MTDANRFFKNVDEAMILVYSGINGIYRDNQDAFDNKPTCYEYHCAQKARNAILNARNAINFIGYCIKDKACTTETVLFWISYVEREIAFARYILDHCPYLSNDKLMSDLSRLGEDLCFLEKEVGNYSQNTREGNERP